MNMDELSEKLFKVLVEKIEVQADQIRSLNKANQSLYDEKENLWHKLQENRDQDVHWWREENELLHRSVDSLSKSNQELQATVREYRLNDPATKALADQFMESEEGQEFCRNGQKIALIKQVRTLTSWGLRESKDYVEAWIEKAEAEYKRQLAAAMAPTGSSYCHAGVSDKDYDEVNVSDQVPDDLDIPF